MDWIVFSLYRFLILPFIYLLARLLSVLKIKNKLFENIQFRLNNEFHYRPTFNADRPSIGVHAASGEIEYAYPLIRKIKEQHPGYNIVVTLSSTSVLKAVKNQPDIDAVGPAPIDLLWLVNRFLRKFNFKLFLFARTDVWPEISRQLMLRKTPTYLFSATFSEASAKKGTFVNSLTRFSLNNLNHIMAVSDNDKHNIQSIGVQAPILVTGDSRYDQVFFKKINTKKNLPILNSTKKILVAGSTWPEDDAILLPAFADSTKDWDLVIAPHEVNEETLKRIEIFFSEKNIKTVRLSELMTKTKPWNVLIVDQYGFLFHLYSWAHLTFVGGSFKSKVHSVMEPLSFFKPVCVGPFHTNNREALEFGKMQIPNHSQNYVQTIHSADDLKKLLGFYATLLDSEYNILSSQLENQLNQKSGSTQKTFSHMVLFAQRTGR